MPPRNATAGLLLAEAAPVKTEEEVVELGAT